MDRTLRWSREHPMAVDGVLALLVGLAGVGGRGEGPGLVSLLVIGYSLYWDGLFRPQGRTYNLISGSWLARHAGLFVGFGALSFANSNVDFLRSIHVGPELELSRNISIATTFVYRRGTTLAGDLRAGGAAPEGTIPTSTTYSWGAGLVLTLSFDAVKFATNPLASGAGK